MKRREFVIVTLGSAAAGAAYLVGVLPGCGSDSDRHSERDPKSERKSDRVSAIVLRLTSSPADLDSVTTVGFEVLQTLPDGLRSRAGIEAALFGATRWEGAGPDDSWELFVEQVRTDFNLRRTLPVRGWLLSRSEALVLALVAVTRDGQPRPIPLPSSGDPILADAARGRLLYFEHCVGCHQQDGHGLEGLVGADLATRMSANDPSLRDSIRNGVGAMPEFGDRLGEQEIGDVLAYLRSRFGSAKR